MNLVQNPSKTLYGTIRQALDIQTISFYVRNYKHGIRL